jgi:hypothetical protein
MNEQQKSLFFIAYGNYCLINQARKRQNTLKRVSLRKKPVSKCIETCSGDFRCIRHSSLGPAPLSRPGVPLASQAPETAELKHATIFSHLRNQINLYFYGVLWIQIQTQVFYDQLFSL